VASYLDYVVTEVEEEGAEVSALLQHLHDDGFLLLKQVLVMHLPGRFKETQKAENLPALRDVGNYPLSYLH
jgi:vacuolar-type H+-ATPase subunit F/Vma7